MSLQRVMERGKGLMFRQKLLVIVMAMQLALLAFAGNPAFAEDVLNDTEPAVLSQNSGLNTDSFAGGISIDLPDNYNGESFNVDCDEKTLGVSSASEENPLILEARWSPNQYSCPAGTYFNAETLLCEECLADHFCSGVDPFLFNEEITILGMESCPNNGTSEKGATSVADCSTTYKCAAGEYLPKGTTACAVCPENSYCGGGNYTYSESSDTGINSCPENLHSWRGSHVVSDCGRILHIGDQKLYLHSDKTDSPYPSLVVMVDGVKYYADMTPVAKGTRTISPDTTESLHVKIDGIEYTIHTRTYDQNGDLNIEVESGGTETQNEGTDTATEPTN